MLGFGLPQQVDHFPGPWSEGGDRQGIVPGRADAATASRRRPTRPRPRTRRLRRRGPDGTLVATPGMDARTGPRAAAAAYPSHPSLRSKHFVSANAAASQRDRSTARGALNDDRGVPERARQNVRRPAVTPVAEVPISDTPVNYVVRPDVAESVADSDARQRRLRPSKAADPVPPSEARSLHPSLHPLLPDVTIEAVSAGTRNAVTWTYAGPADPSGGPDCLAKVGVAGSNPVVRSTKQQRRGPLRRASSVSRGDLYSAKAVGRLVTPCDQGRRAGRRGPRVGRRGWR